jgi:hypothetical protein
MALANTPIRLTTVVVIAVIPLGPKPYFPSLGRKGMKPALRSLGEGVGRVKTNNKINHPLPYPPPSRGRKKDFWFGQQTLWS